MVQTQESLASQRLDIPGRCRGRVDGTGHLHLVFPECYAAERPNLECKCRLVGVCLFWRAFCWTDMLAPTPSAGRRQCSQCASSSSLCCSLQPSSLWSGDGWSPLRCRHLTECCLHHPSCSYQDSWLNRRDKAGACYCALSWSWAAWRRGCPVTLQDSPAAPWPSLLSWCWSLLRQLESCRWPRGGRR